MIQRWKMNAVYGMSGYTPVPDEHGDWVKWSDVRDEIQQLKLRLEHSEIIPVKTKKLKCLKLIPLPGTGGRASTYCMLDEGHEGDCV